MKKISIYIIAVLFLFSCNKAEENNRINNSNAQQPEGSTTILYSGNSKYTKFFDNNVEREVGYYSTKANVNDRDIVGCDRYVSFEGKSTQPVVPFFANNVELRTLGNIEKYKSGEICNLNFDDLYGKNVSFTIGKEQTKSASVYDYDVSMYIPYVIDINYPIASTTELQPMCPYNDLLVEWNKDENNTNGVVVIVEWDGDMVGSDKRDESIRTVDVVDDTGGAILNPELFNDIPDLAMINITLLRGNIDIVEVENTAVKIYAASNSSISIVLAKEPI